MTDRYRLVSLQKRYRSKHLLQLGQPLPEVQWIRSRLRITVIMTFLTKQDVIPIDIVPDYIPEQHTASQILNSHFDNSHMIKVAAMKDITVRISNAADPILLTRTFRLLQELSC